MEGRPVRTPGNIRHIGYKLVSLGFVGDGQNFNTHFWRFLKEGLFRRNSMKESNFKPATRYSARCAGIFLIVFLLIAGTACAQTLQAVDVSSECPQKRKTPKAPENIYTRSNPLAQTIENISLGEQSFQKASPIPCKTCHGLKGNGAGDPDFESTPPARNFTCSETMKVIPDGQLFWVIKNGSPKTSMPAFTDLSDEAVWQLVHYIRFLAK